MSFPQKVNDREWVRHVSARLKLSQRRAGAQRYTAPLPDDRLQLPFYSALHALVYRWFDGELAADELRSATARQTDGGLISQVIDWGASGEAAPVAAPPLLAVAAVAVYHLTGDYNLIERLYPRLAAQHAWFGAQRAAGNGLIEPASFAETLRAQLQPAGTTNGDITERDRIELNCLRAADLDALGHVAYDLGMKAEQQAWEAKAQTVREALAGWAEAAETPLVLFAQVATPAAAEQVAAAVQVAPFGLPFDPAAPQVSMAYHWLVYIGLRQYEQRPAANALAEHSLRLLDQSGYQATYDATSGAALAELPATGAALAVEMLFRERQTIAPGAHCI